MLVVKLFIWSTYINPRVGNKVLESSFDSGEVIQVYYLSKTICFLSGSLLCGARKIQYSIRVAS